MATHKTRLNKENIEAIRPRKKSSERDVHKDTKTPNFELRVTASGIKTFCWYGRVKNGAPVRVTLGKYPNITPEAAEGLAKQYSALAAQGIAPNEEHNKDKETPTVSELFNLYLKNHEQPRKRRTHSANDTTIQRYKRWFSLYLEKPIGKKKVNKVSLSDLAKIHEEIGQTKPPTANKVLEIVSAMYSVAITKGYCTKNPVQGLDWFKDVKRERFLKSSELPYFFQSLADDPSELNRDFFLISLLAGARRANVLAMKWAEIDFSFAEWHIPKTKNDDPHVIPLSPEAMSILHTRKKNSKSKFVFPGEGATGHYAEPKKAWLRVKQRGEIYRLIDLLAPKMKWNAEEITSRKLGAAYSPNQELKTYQELAIKKGIDTSEPILLDLRIHDLRRSLGSWQAKTGASLAIIGKSLGHKSVGATQIYARLDNDPVRESIERATDAMYAVSLDKKPANRSAKK